MTAVPVRLGSDPTLTPRNPRQRKPSTCIARSAFLRVLSLLLMRRFPYADRERQFGLTAIAVLGLALAFDKRRNQAAMRTPARSRSPCCETLRAPARCPEGKGEMNRGLRPGPTRFSPPGTREVPPGPG